MKERNTDSRKREKDSSFLRDKFYLNTFFEFLIDKGESENSPYFLYHSYFPICRLCPSLIMGFEVKLKKVEEKQET